MELKLKYFHGHGWQASWVTGNRVVNTGSFTHSLLDCVNDAILWAIDNGPKTIAHAVMSGETIRKVVKDE